MKKRSQTPFLLFLLACGLVLFGLLAIYNASSVEAYQTFADKFYYVRNQATWAGLGLLILLVLSVFPYKNLKFLALPLLVVNFLALVAVFIPGLGIKIMGARRWLNLGLFSFQPSEFLKLTLSLYLAAWLEEKRAIWPFLLITFFLLGLIVMQPDLGTSIVLIATAFLIYFVAGGSVKSLFLLSLIGLALATVLILTSDYRKSRILTFFNPMVDPLGKSYHLRQILIALGSGGLTGVGLGGSRQKYLYLPEATTDSIFAVIAEEIGFLGSAILITLFLLLIYTGLRVAGRTQNRFGQLLAASLTTWLGIQAFINFGAMTSLVPLTGIPLPFISYGGSSLIVALSSIGILMNIAKEKK